MTDCLLDDLALPDDTLQLFHDERADPHWLTARGVGRDDTTKTTLISVGSRKKGWGSAPCWARVMTNTHSLCG